MTNVVKDPICGKEVDPLRARAVGIFGGVTYYFCSQECKARFKDPRKTPREPTRDIGTRPRRTTDEKLAAGPEPALPDKAEPKEAVAHDKPWVKRARENEESAKVDPSPSVEEELRASRPSSPWPWVIAIMLLAVAGVVLYYYFRR